MGIFDGFIGNASEADIKEVQDEFSAVLAPSEQVEKAYRLVRDLFIFTNKRLILVDKQGITGKKSSTTASLIKTSPILALKPQAASIWRPN